MGTPTDRFRLACGELGWGDAKNGLWFVSIEEGSVWELGQETEIERHYGHGQCFRDDEVERNAPPHGKQLSPNRSQIRPVEAKICVGLSASANVLGPESYRERLWRNGSGVAHANLYPLGKPKLGALPARYEDLFGYGADADQSRQYQQAVKEIRFPRLREARQRRKPQAIVCLGKTFWEEFLEAFDVKGEPVVIEKDKVMAYEVDRLILAPHFAYGHITDVRTKIIAQVLRTWGVTLP